MSALRVVMVVGTSTWEGNEGLAQRHSKLTEAACGTSFPQEYLFVPRCSASNPADNTSGKAEEDGSGARDPAAT